MRFSIRFVHVNSNSPFRFDIFDSFAGLYNSLFMCIISAHYKFVEMPDIMEWIHSNGDNTSATNLI